MTSFRSRVLVLMGALGVVLGGLDIPDALATPITFADALNSFRDTRSLNDVGIPQGDNNQFGADIIPAAGTTITGVQGGFTAGPVICAPIAVDPNFCAASPPFSLNRTGSWNLTFQNGADVATATTPSLAGIPVAPVSFPTNVTISGTGTTPTLSWTVPPSFTPDAVRVNVFDKNVTLPNGQKDVIFSMSFPATQASFQVPSGTLKPDGQYVLNVQLIETRGHVSLPANANNANIFRRSSSFFDFSPLTGGAPPQILLPTVGPAPDPSTGLGATYQFNVAGIRAGQAIFIDPLVAIGYKYVIGAGDPKFASVLLPAVQSNKLTLAFLSGQTLTQVQIAANTQFFFPQGGVDAFDVTGIDPVANLDPANVTAFVTELTFIGDGQFTGSMTPIIEDLAATPEPTTLLLWGTTMAGLGIAARWRRRGRR